MTGARLAIRQILVAGFPQPAVTPQAIAFAAERLVKDAARLRGLLPHIQSVLRELAASAPLPNRLWSDPWLFGPRWEYHPFNHDRLLHTVRLTEPQTVRELAAAIDPGTTGSPTRLQSFLVSLFRAAGKSPPSLSEDQLRFAKVETEGRGTSKGARRNQKRSDLVIWWPRDKLQAQADKRSWLRVVVEAKFGHRVMAGTLSTYLRRHQGPNADFFVLTLKHDPGARRNKAWRQVSWFSLMRHWEGQLCAANDRDARFSGLRKHIWERIRD
jgi:hypothetical protein